MQIQRSSMKRPSCFRVSSKGGDRAGAGRLLLGGGSEAAGDNDLALQGGVGHGLGGLLGLSGGELHGHHAHTAANGDASADNADQADEGEGKVRALVHGVCDEGAIGESVSMRAADREPLLPQTRFVNMEQARFWHT